MDSLENFTVLIADDDPSTRRMLRRVLERAGAQVTEVPDGRSVLRLARTRPFDAVLLDLEMPGIDGLETLRHLRDLDPDLPVLMVSGVATVPISVQATRLGAFDFIEKPIDVGRLVRLTRHAVTQQRLTQAARAAESVEVEDDCCAEILGRSGVIRRTRQQVRRVARYDVPVLVTGESGVGKELLARAIHQGSARTDGPFVAFNAAAVPETLFESTLFGHTRGAFTGADRANTGLMVSASGGTLVLDEIGDLAPSSQVKLLRALETGQVLPVGATRPRDVDVRIVACTNADLMDRIASGTFRADLYYRLRGVAIRIPPLREREDDVLELAGHFLDLARTRYDVEVSGFDPEVQDWLRSYRWPGNVRELMHAVLSSALLTSSPWIGVQDLPPEVRPDNQGAGGKLTSLTGDLSLAASERRHIQRVLHLTGNNRSEAAKQLGVSRSRFYRLLSKHGLD